MDSFSLVSFLSPVKVTGFPEARNPNLMVLAALKPEKEPPAEIVSILNEILPPRQFEESGFKWRQVVSTKQVSRARARVDSIAVSLFTNSGTAMLSIRKLKARGSWTVLDSRFWSCRLAGTRWLSWANACQQNLLRCKLARRESARSGGSSIHRLLMSSSGRWIGLIIIYGDYVLADHSLLGGRSHDIW